MPTGDGYGIEFTPETTPGNATGAGVGIAIASAEGNAIGTIVAGGGGMLLLGVG